MRRTLILAAALALSGAICPSTYADVQDWHVGLHYGQRAFIDSAIEDLDVDRAPVVGLDGVVVIGESGLAWEAGYWRSRSTGHPEDLSVTLTVEEVGVGVGYQTASERSPWYFGIGAAGVFAEADVEGETADGNSFGAYLMTSIRWRVPERASFGIAVRTLLLADLEDGSDLTYAQATAFMALGAK